MAKYKITVVLDDKLKLFETIDREELVKNLQDKVLEFIVREVEWHNFILDGVDVEKLPE
jgi:hypothetical protein